MGTQLLELRRITSPQIKTNQKMTSTQNQPIVITLPSNESSEEQRIAKLFPKSYMLFCGIGQLLCALLVAAIQVVLYIRIDGYHSFIKVMGSGIWCGLCFGIAGILGLIASCRPSNCKLIAFMVMSIIASLFVLPMITFSGIGIASNSYTFRYSHSYRHHHDNVVDLCLWSFQLLIGLAQAAIAITASAFSCRVICCGPKQTAGVVVHNPAGNNPNHGQYTMIPLNNLPTSSIQQQQGVATALPCTFQDIPPSYETVNLPVGNVEEPAQKDHEYQRFDYSSMT